MSTIPVVLTSVGLDLAEFYRVAVDGATLEIALEVMTHVEAGRAVVERALVGDTLIYGLNTGLGHLRNQRVSHEQLLEYQVRIVTAHAGGVGSPLPDEDVRAMMLARIAGMARGGAGVHPGALRMLVAMLNTGVHPIVPEVGSVGASDLMHMAAIALVAIGQGQARYAGEVLPSDEALARAGIAPYVPQPKDGLALINANGASIGLGALTVRMAERIAALADTAGALTLEAIIGNPGPYDAEAAAAKPFPGQIEAAAHLRAVLAGSYLYEPDTNLSVQDPLSFRTMPQVHGALRERIAATRHSVTIELNAIDDNPLVSIANNRLLSNGNFHPMVLALDFDALRVALAHVGLLSERRMSKVSTQTFGSEVGQSGHAGSANPHPISGLLAYSAAALVAALKHLANPATLECPPLDLDVEDHATLAPLAVMLTRQALTYLETILVIEAVLAADVLESRGATPRLGVGTGEAFVTIRQVREQLGATAPAAVVVEATRVALAAVVVTEREVVKMPIP